MIVRRQGLSPFWNVVVVCFGVLLLVVALMAVAQHLSTSQHHRPIRKIAAAWRHPRAGETPPFPTIVDRRAQRTADFYWQTNDHGEWRWIRVGRRPLWISVPGRGAYEAHWRIAGETDDPVRPPRLTFPEEGTHWRGQWETNSDFEYRWVIYRRTSSDEVPQ